MSVHIGAERGDIADIVLLPGDPLRAEFAAKEFLDDAVCYHKVRGMLGYTGTWKSARVSIQGTGMGIPSISIYVNELLRDYGCRTLVRIGSCGSCQDDPNAWKHWAGYGVLAVEMEANALYTLAARADAHALAICTVSDSLVNREQLSSEERQSSFREMIALALDTACGTTPDAAAEESSGS